MRVVNRVAMRQPESVPQPRFAAGSAEAQASAMLALYGEDARRLAWMRARHSPGWRAVHRALRTVTVH